MPGSNGVDYAGLISAIKMQNEMQLQMQTLSNPMMQMSLFGGMNDMNSMALMPYMNPFAFAPIFNMGNVPLQNSTNETNNFNYTGQSKGAKQPLSKEEQARAIQIAKDLNCSNPEALIGIIYAESGGNPQAVNRSSRATGLIQFMPRTARGLGTSTNELKNMTTMQQLDFVEKYLQTAKRQAGFRSDEQISAGQLYALVFMPSAAKHESGVLCKHGSGAFRGNSALSSNGSTITTRDLEQRAFSHLC